MNTHKDEDVDQYVNEADARARLKPTFVDGFIPVDKILFFYTSYEFPFHTNVQVEMDSVCIDMEVHDFQRLYESHKQ